MNWRFASLLTIPTIVVSLVVAADIPSKEHPEIANIKKLYQTELEPVQKRYRSRLEAAQKELTRKGDLDGALAVKAELESLGGSADVRVPAASKAGTKTEMTIKSLKGNWTVKYGSGNVRTYIVRDDGSVQMLETMQTGKLTKDGDDLLLDFNDGKIERLSLKTGLFVEHFDPKTSFSNGSGASQFGIGDKTKQ